MRDFRDAKAMARSLRDALKAKAIETTHTEALELIANAFGYENWNILSAKIDEASASATASASVESLASVADIDALVKELGVQERVLLFCLASGTDWQQAGVTFKTVASQCFGRPSWARVTVKIMPDGRLALTWWAGRAALRALLRDL
jgi:Glyoxalase superfamily protein